MTIHHSEIDRSINYTTPYRGSMIESRFVSREADQTIAYLSSHNGCKMACRFCHLTATGQIAMEDVSPELFAYQLHQVISGETPTPRLNINFMARGEPLENCFVLNNWQEIYSSLENVIQKEWGNNVEVKKNISTIIPASVVGKKALDVFGPDVGNTHFYWSLYSLRQAFRKKWMIRAASIDGCLDFLEGFPVNHIVVHMAFIEGQNDSEKDVEGIVQFLKDNFERVPRINIVRYNPYSSKYGKESPHLERIMSQLGPTTKVIDRVGFDVAASCGMFMT